MFSLFLCVYVYTYMYVCILETVSYTVVQANMEFPM